MCIRDSDWTVDWDRLNCFGRRRFAVARPLTWNSLPDGLRDPELSFDTFKRQISWLMYMQHVNAQWKGIFHRRAVAQPCVNGDRLSMENGKIRPLADPRPLDRSIKKIWNRWLRPRDDPLCKISCKSVHCGLLGKGVKYNENFSALNIAF